MIAIALKTKTKYGKRYSNWSFYYDKKQKLVTISRDNIIISVTKKENFSDNNALKLLLSEIKRYNDIPLYDTDQTSSI